MFGSLISIHWLIDMAPFTLSEQPNSDEQFFFFFGLLALSTGLGALVGTAAWPCVRLAWVYTELACVLVHSRTNRAKKDELFWSLIFFFFLVFFLPNMW